MRDARDDEFIDANNNMTLLIVLSVMLSINLRNVISSD